MLDVMASMAFDGDVRKNLLDRTDAEKVFRNRIAVESEEERRKNGRRRDLIKGVAAAPASISGVLHPTYILARAVP